MNLYDELAGLISAYVARQRPLQDVYRWLTAHVQAVADSGDDNLQDLDGDAWTLISEWQAGHRDEASLRAELSRAVYPTLSSGQFIAFQAEVSGFGDDIRPATATLGVSHRVTTRQAGSSSLVLPPLRAGAFAGGH